MSRNKFHIYIKCNKLDKSDISSHYLLKVKTQVYFSDWMFIKKT